MTDLRKIRGIGPALAGALQEMGIASAQDLAEASPATLTALRGVSQTRAALLVAAAQDCVEDGTATPSVGPAPQDAPTEEPTAPELPGPLVVVTSEEKRGGKAGKDGKKKKDKDRKKKDKADKKKKKKKKKDKKSGKKA